MFPRRHSILLALSLTAAIGGCAQAPVESRVSRTSVSAPSGPASQIAPKTAPSTQPRGATGTETPEQRDARMAWWRESRFGMFIHWGVYAVPGGIHNGWQTPGLGEWIMLRGEIPVDVYGKYAAQFNPTKFNADEWVSLAKAAGMKYMVITAKHHDGFAMFRSSASPYNIYDASPFKRDPIAELAQACAKQGLRFGCYYSQAQDWHHPGGATLSKKHWDKAQDGDFDTYLKTIAVPQVNEILSNYGPISVLWFDTPAEMTPERAALFFPVLQKQPQIIINNRLGGGYKGDTETPEQFIPAGGYPGRDWETCMTINGTWGYKSFDTDFKPTSLLIRNLVNIASKGGNYLLNVGPDAAGTIPEAEVQRLREVGQWMSVNGEAIYGTSAGPFNRPLDFGRCTSKGNTLYLHVFEWPANGRLHVPVASAPTRAYLLSNPRSRIPYSMDGKGVLLALPSTAPDPVASVIALEFASKPTVLSVPVYQAQDRSITLGAALADIQGQNIKQVNAGHDGVIDDWDSTQDTITWPVEVKSPGKYLVEITYACPKGQDGAEFVFTLGTQTLQGKVQETPAERRKRFKTVGLGTVDLPAGGPIRATLQAISKPGKKVMELANITLKPAP